MSRSVDERETEDQPGADSAPSITARKLARRRNNVKAEMTAINSNESKRCGDTDGTSNGLSLVARVLAATRGPVGATVPPDYSTLEETYGVGHVVCIVQGHILSDT